MSGVADVDGDAVAGVTAADAADAADAGLAGKVLAPSYHYKQAITLIELGRIEEAKDVLSHIASEHPNSRRYPTAVALGESL